MSIFNGVAMTAHEAEQAHIKQMELDQNTLISVRDILDIKAIGCRNKYVMCLVSNENSCDAGVRIRIVTDCSKDRDGYLDSYGGYKDIYGDTWDYAKAINMDGTAMSVYDYKKATSSFY